MPVWGEKPAQVQPSGWEPSRGVGSPRRDSDVVPGRFHAWKAKDGDPTDPDLVCLLGERAPTLIRGLGGWQQIERGGRRAGSHWPGGETPAFQIELRLENHAVPTGADGTRNKMKALERLCGGDFAGDEAPPRIQWAANAALHDYSRAPQWEWVCEEFSWDYIDADDRAVPREAWATVVLAVHEGDRLERLKRANPFPRKTLRKGETLRQFAKRVLGDPKRWADVADLNRDNRKCPQTPDRPSRHRLSVAVPPREPRSGGRRRDRRD